VTSCSAATCTRGYIGSVGSDITQPDLAFFIENDIRPSVDGHPSCDTRSDSRSSVRTGASAGPSDGGTQQMTVADAPDELTARLTALEEEAHRHQGQ
jgi:hypothetical protein